MTYQKEQIEVERRCRGRLVGKLPYGSKPAAIGLIVDTYPTLTQDHKERTRACFVYPRFSLLLQPQSKECVGYHPCVYRESKRGFLPGLIKDAAAVMKKMGPDWIGFCIRKVYPLRPGLILCDDKVWAVARNENGYKRTIWGEDFTEIERMVSSQNEIPAGLEEVENTFLSFGVPREKLIAEPYSDFRRFTSTSSQEDASAVPRLPR